MKLSVHVRAVWAFVSILVVISRAANGEDLIEMYGDVKKWSTFSQRFDISEECANNRPLRVGYFTRHVGTLWDFITVASQLQVSWTRVNPVKLQELLTGFGEFESSHESAMAKWDAVGQAYCHMADILQFCDVIADSRPLLEGGCSAPIILQVTNRFDFGVTDRKDYYGLMAEASKRPNVWWVVNNPYEALYLKNKGVHIPADRIRLLRPVGAAMLHPPSAETASQRASKIAIVHRYPNHYEQSTIVPWLVEQYLDHLVDQYDGHYGGPLALAQYRGVIHTPYQVSVMKMYEGMAAGVAFIVPNEKFFMSLLRRWTGVVFPDRELVLSGRELDWQSYIEWYNPEFRDALIYYKSLEELEQIITGNGQYTDEFFATKKATARSIMERMRNVTLAGYRDLYAEARKYACEMNGKEDVFSEGMKPRPTRAL